MIGKFFVVDQLRQGGARLPLFGSKTFVFFCRDPFENRGVNPMLAVNPSRTEQPKADSTDALVPVPPVQISPSDLWRRGEGRDAGDFSLTTSLYGY